MFDDSDRRQSLPLLSLCQGTVDPEVSLTKRRIARIVVGALVVSVLGVSHIALRFAVKDIRLQHGRLQKDERELLQIANRLEMLNESLCTPDLLKQHAVEQLGMTEQMDDAIEYVALPPSVQAKYLRPLSAPRADRNGDKLDNPDPSSMERVAGVLSSVDRAMAGAGPTQ